MQRQHEPVQVRLRREWLVVVVTVSFLPKLRSASAGQANRVAPLFLQSPPNVRGDLDPACSSGAEAL